MSTTEEIYTRAQIAARLREMAQSLDVLTNSDFALLAGVKASTTEAWRKRGVGPRYALIGNNYFYPRAAVAEYLSAKTRERSPVMRGEL